MKKQTFSLMLLTLTSAFCLTACGGGDNPSGKGGKTVTGDTNHETLASLHEGVNDVTYTDTIFAFNYLSEYKIVYDPSIEGADEAASSIKSNILAACGATLDIVTDAPYSENAKYIVLGNEDLLGKNGFNFDYSDIDDIYTYRIKTIGNSICVYGKGKKAFQFAHIRLLKVLLGCDVMSTRRTVYVLNDTEIKPGDTVYLPECDIKERADYYLGTYCPNSSNYSQRYEMGFATENPIMYTQDKQGVDHFVHNSFDYLPIEDYGESDPEFYSVGTSAWAQLCYTAHGDNNKQAKMIDIITDKMIGYIAKNPNKHIITLTQEDSETGCECDTCKAFYARYVDGVMKTPYSSTILAFFKKLEPVLEEKIELYNEKVGDDEKLVMPWITCFAYHLTETPPAPSKVDDLVDLRDTNCAVFMAPIYGNFNHSYYDNVYKTKDGLTNQEYMQRFNGWSSCISHVLSWTYEISYFNYSTPYNSFSAQCLNNRYMYNLGARCLYPEGQTYNTEGFFFHRLKDYLDASSTFDVTVDTNALIKKWFKYFYKEAGPYIEELFNKVCDRLTYIEENLFAQTNFGFVMYNNVKQKDCFTMNQLKSYVDLINKAYKAIDKYKSSDPLLYDDINYYLESESLFPYYFLTTLYDDELSTAEKQEYRARFVECCHDTGVKYETHAAARQTGVTFDSSLFAEWGF